MKVTGKALRLGMMDECRFEEVFQYGVVEVSVKMLVVANHRVVSPLSVVQKEKSFDQSNHQLSPV